MTETARWRAALAALVLGVGVAASPAEAASLSFGFGFGHGTGIYFDQSRQYIGATCLNDYRVRQMLAEEGYTQIFLGQIVDGETHGRATRGDWVYKLVIDTCDREIISRKRLRPAN